MHSPALLRPERWLQVDSRLAEKLAIPRSEDPWTGWLTPCSRPLKLLLRMRPKLKLMARRCLPVLLWLGPNWVTAEPLPLVRAEAATAWAVAASEGSPVDHPCKPVGGHRSQSRNGKAGPNALRVLLDQRSEPS